MIERPMNELCAFYLYGDKNIQMIVSDRNCYSNKLLTLSVVRDKNSQDVCEIMTVYQNGDKCNYEYFENDYVFNKNLPDIILENIEEIVNAIKNCKAEHVFCTYRFSPDRCCEIIAYDSRGRIVQDGCKIMTSEVQNKLTDMIIAFQNKIATILNNGVINHNNNDNVTKEQIKTGDVSMPEFKRKIRL